MFAFLKLQCLHQDMQCTYTMMEIIGNVNIICTSAHVLAILFNLVSIS